MTPCAQNCGDSNLGADQKDCGLGEEIWATSFPGSLILPHLWGGKMKDSGNEVEIWEGYRSEETSCFPPIP